MVVEFGKKSANSFDISLNIDHIPINHNFLLVQILSKIKYKY